MAQGADYLRQQNNPILNHCNTHLETEKIKKDHLDLYGFQELMQLHET